MRVAEVSPFVDRHLHPFVPKGGQVDAEAMSSKLISWKLGLETGIPTLQTGKFEDRKLKSSQAPQGLTAYSCINSHFRDDIYCAESTSFQFLIFSFLAWNPRCVV